MDNKAFKKMVKDIFISESLTYNSRYKKFIKEFEDLYLLIDIQKSNFSNGYYINYSLYCKELHSFEEIFGMPLGDLSGRLVCMLDGHNTDLFDLELLSEYQINSGIDKSIKELICILNGGIKSYLRYYPNSIRRAPVWAQQYLKSLAIQN